MESTVPNDSPDPNRPPTFEVTYRCGNCGGEWSRQYPPQSNVQDKHDGAYVGSNEINAFGDFTRVPCPTCDLHKFVSVIDRSPLTEGETT